uniref:Uncharacterized protein n=1 Tax=Romanomermis culicivorax TaxID=13658 RepID=A0A915K3H2_ROMCU
MQVWKKKVDNTDPWIQFWEVIDRTRAREILEVEKGMKSARIGYKVRQPYNRTAAGKIPQHWVKRLSKGHQHKQLESLDKDRKRKHESHHHEEQGREKSMSKEKKRKGDCNESECCKCEEHESKEREERKERLRERQ